MDIAAVRRRFSPGTRGYGVGSAVGLIAGVALIGTGRPSLTAVGVVVLLLAVVSLLFAVTVFIGDW